MKKKNQIEAEDFDEDFDRTTRKDTNVRQLFQDDIGREEIIKKLEHIQKQVRQLKALGLDVKEEIPFNFLFRGPPGTGKTTTARKMGKVYYDMGFLDKAVVEECSATDLIGEYVGHTGPKVQKVLEKSLGRVLLIDEAYRFAEGRFAKEAIDEIVDCVTKPKYQGKLIIILAGYEHDINRLLSVNPGLTSRFPETIDFKPLKPDACFQLLVDLLRKRKTELSRKGKDMDINCLERPSALFLSRCTATITSLAAVEGWASARDVKQLARNVFHAVDLEAETLKLEEKQVTLALHRMLRDRQSKMVKSAPPIVLDDAADSTHTPLAPSKPALSIATGTSMETQQTTNGDELTDEDGSAEETPISPESPDNSRARQVIRDAGVSDEVWEQLQKDQAEEQRRETEYRKLLEAQKHAKDAAREKIVRQLIEEEERRKEEAAKQAKLMSLGTCPVGYHWIKQDTGYRCAGGSHYLSNDEIEKHMQ
jgi:SpoVK/Ycf46/Vps4 family AAA+-type ATPase